MALLRSARRPFRLWFTFALGFSLLLPMAAQAQLRVVTYNTLTGQSGGVQTARPEISTVLESIGLETYNGLAKPIDVLLLQEQYSTSVSTQSFVDVLNNIYGPGVYARSSLNGFTSSFDGEGGAPALVYNTQSVQLLSEVRLGDVGGNPDQPRSTLRYQLQPVGYDSSAEFYVYNSHYKASTGTENAQRRLGEAIINRDDADALGEGTSIIYGGDFNIRSSSEAMYQELLSSGPGQAFDPIDVSASWHNQSSLAYLHTQSPCLSVGGGGDCTPGFASGGVDDRFDFQLVSGELLDNEGLSYIENSYHAFGNNGSTFNNAINVGNTITFPGVTKFTKSEILDALHDASDHLPVVADYQLPAVLDAVAGTVPSMLDRGQAFSLDLLVRNAANVVAAFGADELDYTFTTTGDLIGSGSGIEQALAAGQTHFVSLDTTTPGAKSGSIIVSTSSQGAANSEIVIPVSFQVGEGGTATPVVIAQALQPTVAEDINVTSFSFGGSFTTERTDTNNGGTLPVGSDARSLAFSAAGDQFGIEDRGDGSTFALLDDSLAVPNDNLGIIGAADQGNFFGVTDTVNGDNNELLSAEWAFDISEATGSLSVSVDIAAMGDFEDPQDIFMLEASIDGGAFSSLFTIATDEAATQTYALEDGDSFTLNDPLRVDGVLLDNNFQTFTTALAGTGNELVVRFSALSDGGSEAFALRNLVIEGLVGDAVLAGDFNGDDIVDAADFTLWRDHLGAADDTAINDAGDGEPGITLADYDVWKANFGATAATLAESSNQVPEPTSFALFGLLAAGYLGFRAQKSSPLVG